MKPETDDILWSQCLQGNKNAFKELYMRFYSLLYNYGCKLTSDSELVEDTIQNLFVKLMQNYEQLSPTQHVKGYLLLSFRNKLYDTFKNQKINCSIELYEDVFSSDPVSYEDEDNENQINISKLLKAYHMLSSRQKEILYLYYVCKLKHDVIAETLHINPQSSKNLLFRSLSKLRELFFSIE